MLRACSSCEECDPKLAVTADVASSTFSVWFDKGLEALDLELILTALPLRLIINGTSVLISWCQNFSETP